MATVETYGFWGMLILLIVQNAVIPIAKQVIPKKVNASITVEERTVAAMEQSNKILATMAADHKTMMSGQEKLSNENTAIQKALSQHSEALAVLLDRVGRTTTKRKQ